MNRHMKMTTTLSLVLAGVVLCYAFAMTNVAWASKPKPATSVQVINPESDPALTRDVENPANRPFAKTLCLTDISGACDAGQTQPELPSEFVVPSLMNTGEPVKQLVIEFVSGTCIGSGRSTFVEIASQPSGGFDNPDTGDNFTRNRFPLAVAQFLQAPGVNGAQAFAQSARIYLEPDVTVRISFDIVAAGGIVCKAQLNGHFVVN